MVIRVGGAAARRGPWPGSAREFRIPFGIQNEASIREQAASGTAHATASLTAYDTASSATYA